MLSACSNSQKKEVIVVKSENWKVNKINVIDTASSRFIPYFQETDSVGDQGYAELKDYGIRGKELKIYDGMGSLIIESNIINEDGYSGGYEARTTFYNKPNKLKSIDMVQKTGGLEITKQNTVFDAIIKVHETIRLIPELFSTKINDLSGIQFDVPITRESVYVQLH